MTSMNESSLNAFLARDHHAILATVGSDGRPQLTPVWYLYEDGRLYVSAQSSTVKVRNLRRNPAISICVDGGRDDVRYVVFKGDAEIIEAGEPGQEEMRRRIIRRYSANEEAADAYYDAIRHTDAVTIVLEPERLISQDFSG